MIRSEARRLPLWLALPIAVPLVGATLLLLLLLQPNVQLLNIVFVLPIMVSALLGGLEAGLMATFLCGGAVECFLPSLSTGEVGGHTQLIALLVTGVAVVFLVEGVDRSRRRIARDGALLGVTLASIGDAVIIADSDGRIAFLNAEAERLTCRTSAEALGRRLRTVIAMRDEEADEPAESLVDKVLRLGTVAGLANHSVLVAGDGREIPIDGSAAPVRERDGTVHGVVLVFRDTSDLRRADERTRHLASFLELSPDPVMEVDPSGELIFCNAAAFRALERLGMERRDYHCFLPSDLDAILERLDREHESTLRRELSFNDRVFAETIHVIPRLGVARIYAYDITELKEEREKEIARAEEE